MSVRFTDRWLRTLRAAPGERREYADSACAGLRVRVGARGVAFSALIRDGAGNRRRVPLGRFPELSLADARRMVGELNPALVAPRPEPGAEPRLEPSRGEPEPRRGTVADMIATTLAWYEARGSDQVRVLRTYLERGELAAIHSLGADTPAAEVTPDMVTRWLRRVAAANVNTHHPRSCLSRAFAVAMKSDYDPHSPAADIRFGIVANPVAPVAAAKVGVRDRVLSLDELRQVLKGFRGRNVSPTARAIVVGMIAMGGARGSEIMRARRDWLRERSGRQWLCLPKTKNGHPHDLPTTAAFRQVVKGFEVLAGDLDSPYLFPSPHRPDEPLTPTSLAQCVRRWCERAQMEPWQPRDLRRTMKTHLLERRPDLERALEVWHNHGATAGVARRHYDRATYAALKLEVASEIDRLCGELEIVAVGAEDA